MVKLKAPSGKEVMEIKIRATAEKEEGPGRPDIGSDRKTPFDYYYHEQFMKSFISASYSKWDDDHAWSPQEWKINTETYERLGRSDETSWRTTRESQPDISHEKTQHDGTAQSVVSVVNTTPQMTCIPWCNTCAQNVYREKWWWIATTWQQVENLVTKCEIQKIGKSRIIYECMTLHNTDVNDNIYDCVTLHDACTTDHFYWTWARSSSFLSA